MTTLHINHVYILVSILVPVGAVCIFASYMLFFYDSESPGCRECCSSWCSPFVSWYSNTPKAVIHQADNEQKDTVSIHVVCVQHPDQTMDVGTTVTTSDEDGVV